MLYSSVYHSMKSNWISRRTLGNCKKGPMRTPCHGRCILWVDIIIHEIRQREKKCVGKGNNETWNSTLNADAVTSYGGVRGHGR